MESKFDEIIHKAIYNGFSISLSIRNFKGVICTLEDDYAINFLQCCNDDKIEKQSVFEEQLGHRLLITIYI